MPSAAAAPAEAAAGPSPPGAARRILLVLAPLMSALLLLLLPRTADADVAPWMHTLCMCIFRLLLQSPPAWLVTT